MNNWLITWFVEEENCYGVTTEYKEEKQYIADAIMLLQKEVLSVEGLIKVTVEPIDNA